MNNGPKNFAQAIDELEEENKKAKPNGSGVRDRLQSELANLEEALAKIKPHIDDLGQKVGTEAKKAKDKVEDQVQKNPWAAIGIVGVVFFLLGFLLAGTRRRDD